jgi:uncharacterized protein YggE
MRRASLSIALLALLVTPVLGAEESDEERRPVIVVTGTATVHAPPDRAFLTLAVESRDPNPAAAQRRNATVMDAVFAKLKGAGIAPDALRTLSYELREDFDFETGKRISRGFLARNAIEVRLDDLARIGEVIDLATAAGANSVGGVRFDVKDRAAVEREALTRATADARARADAVAAGGGVKVGRLLRIEERGGFAPPPPGPFLAKAAMAEAAPETPILPGEIELRADVTLTVALEP